MRRYEEVHGVAFSRVIKYRGDIRATRPDNVFFEMEEGVVYVPDQPDYGGLSDQIAVGDRQVMEGYCDLVNHLSKVKMFMKRYENIWNLYNMERFLGLYILEVANLPVSRFAYTYSLEPTRHTKS